MIRLILTCALSLQAAVLPMDLVRKADGFFKAGDFPQALELGEEALNRRLSRPQQARAYWLVGKSQEALGSPDKALSLYQIAVRLYPRDTDLLLALGDLFQRVGLEDRAQPWYKAALKVEPFNAAAHVGMGRLLSRQGLFEAAVEHFKSALDRDKDDRAALLGLGRARAGQGRFEEAEKELRLALRAEPDVELLVALAEIQKKRGARAEAIATLGTAVAAAPERTDIILRRAAWLLGAGRLDEGAAALNGVLKGSPDDALAHFLLGWVSWKKGQSGMKDVELAAAQETDVFVRRAAEAVLKARAARSTEAQRK